MKFSRIDGFVDISTASESDCMASNAPFGRFRSSQTIHSTD